MIAARRIETLVREHGGLMNAAHVLSKYVTRYHERLDVANFGCNKLKELLQRMEVVSALQTYSPPGKSHMMLKVEGQAPRPPRVV